MEKGIVYTIILALLIWLEVWAFKLIWNWIVVMVFGLSTIGMWESFGIIILLNFIGSFFKK